MPIVLLRMEANSRLALSVTANKPIYRVPCPSRAHRALEQTIKTLRRSNKNFLWFASGGMVHKGLDLVLESLCRNASIPFNGVWSDTQ